MSYLVVKGQSWAPLLCSDCACSCGDEKEDNLSSFEKRRKEATSQALTIRLTWVFLHASIICSLFTVDTSLSRAWNRPHLAYLASYLFLALTNLGLYLALCVSNPGFLQPGVHALSLATAKRDPGAGSGAEEAAELGIGGLAHVDVPYIGRRTLQGGQQRERQSKGGCGRLNSLDRTATLPNLPSQSTAEALMDVSSPGRPWDQSPADRSAAFEGTVGSPLHQQKSAGAALHEAKTASQAGILAPGSRSSPDQKANTSQLAPTIEASKIRIRGSSLGCDQELRSLLAQANPDWLDGPDAGAAEPLLGKESCSNHASNEHSRGKLEEDHVPRKSSKPSTPSYANQHRRSGGASWWEGPNPGRWCEYCGAWQLLRSRHCHDCGRCVRRFDHHCAWIGRCIGQDNHLAFWWYLVAQLALLSWTTHIIVEGFEGPMPLTIGRFATLFICCVPTVLLTGFVAMLFGYHTYLGCTNGCSRSSETVAIPLEHVLYIASAVSKSEIERIESAAHAPEYRSTAYSIGFHILQIVTAQTTYELVMGADGCPGPSKVPYLRHLPRGTCPFSQGMVQNVLHFCCDRAGTSYQMPAVLSGR